jgi:hypothetical protein
VDERKGAVKETAKLECENRKLGKFIERLEDRLSCKRERKELSVGVSSEYALYGFDELWEKERNNKKLRNVIGKH